MGSPRNIYKNRNQRDAQTMRIDLSTWWAFEIPIYKLSVFIYE
jgi:hypothetical protein